MPSASRIARRERALEIDAISHSRTPNQQLKRLNAISSDSSMKERSRLEEMISAGHGNTPKNKLPQGWRQAKSVNSEDKSQAAIEKIDEPKAKRSHPKRRRKSNKTS